MGFIQLLKKLFSVRKGNKDRSYVNNMQTAFISYESPVNTIDPEVFDEERKRIHVYSTEGEIRSFLTFLSKYRGGYIKRYNGRIVKHEYLGKEKGILKGIYYNVILPGKNFSDLLKEDFRSYLVGIGVTGLDEKPDYESIRNKNSSVRENNIMIQASGYKAEKKVNDTLSYLTLDHDRIYSNVVIESKGKKREFDHIVVSNGKVLILETKAFGLSAGFEEESCILHIDEDDRWMIEKKEKIKNLACPTEQIMGQMEIIDEILSGIDTIIEYILVLPNPKLELDIHRLHKYKIMTLLDLSVGFEDLIGSESKSSSDEIIGRINRSIKK